ncbi:hypothetical protein NIES2104_09350 [Leptolyngbya sp. NIES-2104]|nr:hypothetical protein NIES2104_09350 [Leptolyngbya sp. NIES-2104]
MIVLTRFDLVTLLRLKRARSGFKQTHTSNFSELRTSSVLRRLFHKLRIRIQAVLIAEFKI